MAKQQRKQKTAGPLTQNEIDEIMSADPTRLDQIISQGAKAIEAIDAAERENEDVQAAKTKLKELVTPFRDDRKRERARVRMAYQCLEASGKA